jgi:hypothetical protein
MRTIPVILLLIYSFASNSQNQTSSCSTDEAFKKLDFWVGDWSVMAGDTKVGDNKIEKLLNDCLIQENWKGSGGGEGKSWFFYDANTKQWKQIWITQNSTRPGGLKEKILIKEFEDGGVRFQGKYPNKDGNIILDRTTLTPMKDGSVNQLIEISTDEGNTWISTFEAVYIRKLQE